VYSRGYPISHIRTAVKPNHRQLRQYLVIVLCLITVAPLAAAKTSKKASLAMPQVDAVVRDAIAQHQVPGAVVLIGHHGHVIYRKAFGMRSLEPRREPMTVDTVFDLASLTKVIATTPCVMQLMEEGKIRLNDPVVRYIPEFGVNGKQDITVRQLLIHYSGLAPDLDLTQPWQGKETAYQMAFQEKPLNPPGARFVYSDINFIMLGALVERITGMSLNDYAEQYIFKPLKMTHTQFLPPHSWIRKIAPTQYDEHNVMLRGVVHDPTARRMGGVAGHAGLFSTADDLGKYCQALLDGKLLSRLAIEKMITPQQPPNATDVRGLGWDIDTPFSSNRGELLPVGSFGHTGFTGTSVWIDPMTQTYIIILANGVHPRGQGTAVPLRSKVATAVAASLHLTVSEKEQLRLARLTGYNEADAAARNLQVRDGDAKSGIDVLEAGNFALDVFQSKGTQKRIGLLTNQTGVDAQGQRTIDVLAKAPGVSLVAIFSPEHGVTGTLDTTAVGNTVDAATKIPVYSVYGATDAQRRPSLDVLKGLDAVFIDVQNAGARYYTYETTMGYFLEAAAKAGIEVVVLDRPNPITGSIVQGPMSDPGTASFVNYFQEPVRHGMTMGELAQMFNSELNIHAKLTVVPMQGWMRGDWYDSTSLTWINPSPNLRSLTEAALYPGVGLVEGTNVSVGRGTDTPFELLGAPWVKSRELADYLNSREIQGVRFVPVDFTPDSSVYAHQLCHGVNIVLLDRSVLDAPEMGVELASALHKLYAAAYDIHRLPELLNNKAAFDAIVAGEDPRRIAQDWREQLGKFQDMRQKYLIYK
jgi:uncharacterized protein YbbC (DUF1343 family)/CubicO group peptidase (beta-lactamase class C family)